MFVIHNQESLPLPHDVEMNMSPPLKFLGDIAERATTDVRMIPHLYPKFYSLRIQVFSFNCCSKSTLLSNNGL